MSVLEETKRALSEFKELHTSALAELKEKNAALTDRIEELESRGGSPGRPAGRESAEVKAFAHFCRTGNRAELDQFQRKDMSIAGGASEGQAMVPEVIADQIINRAIKRSALAGMVRRTGPVSSDYVRLLNLRGATASWASETGTRSATDTPQLREIRPTHGELYALPTFTRWLAEDSKFNVSAFVEENVADTFSKSLESAILTGSGTNRPTGIFQNTPVTTADGASPERSADTVQYIECNNSPVAITADCLIDLLFSLKRDYRMNARWLTNDTTLAAIRKLKDNDDQYLWRPGLERGIDEGDGALLGKPLETSEYMDDIGANNFPVAVGDWNAAYELVRIGPMVMIRDDISVKGKISLYVAQRWGGRLMDNDAVKVLRTT